MSRAMCISWKEIQEEWNHHPELQNSLMSQYGLLILRFIELRVKCQPMIKLDHFLPQRIMNLDSSFS